MMVHRMSPMLLARLRAPTTLLGGFYFFNYGGLGSLFPFLSLLLAARGLSPTQISWVMVMIPLFNLLMPPIWGAVADALQARASLLRLAAFGCALSVFALLPSWALLGNLLALSLLSAFRAPISALADAATYAALGARGASFGQVRVWGSIGFGVGALLVGHLGGSLRPAVLIGVTGLIYLCSGFCTLGLPAPVMRRERGVVREAIAWLLRPALLLLLAGNTFYYLAHAILDAFLSLHLQDLGFEESVISYAWAIGVSAETLVMFAAPALLRTRVPAPLLLSVSSLVAAARWHLLTVWRRPAAILLLQSLHGITFGLWYLAYVQYVQSRAPERLRTTLQATAHAMVGLGSVAGYLLGGPAFERGRGQAALGLAFRSSLAALVCYALMPLGEKRHPEHDGAEAR